MTREVYAKDYYQKNKETILKRSRERYKKKKAEILEQHKKSHKNRDPAELLLQRAKSRARREKLPFNLTIDDIYIPDKCPVFNFTLKRNRGGKSGAPNSYSIDKIIPELGYVKGNIQVISHKANVMKHNASPEELIQFALWILEFNDILITDLQKIDEEEQEILNTPECGCDLCMEIDDDDEY